MVGTTSNWEDELRGWLKPFSDRLGHDIAAANVSALCGRADRTRRSQERSANGGAACAWRLRPAASFCCGWRLGRGAIRDRAAHSSGSARWRQRRRVGNRRYGGAEEGHSLGRRRCAIRFSARQDRQLPNFGVTDARPRRSSGDGGIAAFPSRQLGQRSAAAEASWCSRPKYRTSRTKPEIALAEIDRLISIGVRFRCVLADAGYGLSAPFRQGLTARKLAWAVGIPRHLKVYPVGVQLIWPVTKVRGRPRKRHVPDSLSTAAEDMLASAQWRTVSWRSGTKGRLKARFAAVRVRTADGPPQRIWDKGQQHLPGDEAWLIGEHRASGEKKYYLANLAAGMTSAA